MLKLNMLVEKLKNEMGVEDFNLSVGKVGEENKIGWFVENEEDGKIYFCLDCNDGMDDMELCERLEEKLFKLLDELGVDIIS